MSTGPATPPLTIAAVERDTGLSKDTLRIWERRSGFPQPVRDAQGERAYPPEQVDKLRLLKRLLDSGHRPGKLMRLDADALAQLGAGPVAAAPAPGLEAPYLELLQAHDVAGLRRQLHQALLSLGLERFVADHLARLNTAVGEAWMRGVLSVAQEHVYTEGVQLVLRQAIGSIPEPASGATRVLLATLPQEPHGLGLLMAEALLSLHGCRCTSLGVRVPLDGIAEAAAVSRAAVVALSFSSSFSGQQAVAALADLRRLLPAGVVIWAGGSNPALRRRLPAGVLAVPDIGLVPQLLKPIQSAVGPGEP